MKEQTFKFEKELMANGFNLVIGVDEAGRGPLAGPVVAAAAACKNTDPVLTAIESLRFKLIRDSKTLSEKQREGLYDFIYAHFDIGVGVCDHKTIDKINILEATHLAMKKAVTELASNIRHGAPRIGKGCLVRDTKHIILVDGNKKIPNLSIEQRTIVGGDNLVKTISAASIIAKVFRDRMMRQAHERYPYYYFNKHKGYGTRKHLEMLDKFGPCEIHRKTFFPVKNWTNRDKEC